MASSALVTWRTARRGRLQELVAAHRTIGGSGPGRKWRTEQLNWALVLRLAGEFQGFARDLHTAGSRTFAAWAAGANGRVEEALLAVLLGRRRLDRENARPATLAADFERFGMDWWPALTAYDRRTNARQRHLHRVNRARNAIAHDKPHELDVLRGEGFPLTLPVVRVWWRALDGLAGTMDAVLSGHLANVFGRAKPW